jgi:hypothetical protein
LLFKATSKSKAAKGEVHLLLPEQGRPHIMISGIVGATFFLRKMSLHFQVDWRFRLTSGSNKKGPHSIYHFSCDFDSLKKKIVLNVHSVQPSVFCIARHSNLNTIQVKTSEDSNAPARLPAKIKFKRKALRRKLYRIKEERKVNDVILTLTASEACKKEHSPLAFAVEEKRGQSIAYHTTHVQ